MVAEQALTARQAPYSAEAALAALSGRHIWGAHQHL